jgi:hypothetical protein
MLMRKWLWLWPWIVTVNVDVAVTFHCRCDPPTLPHTHTLHYAARGHYGQHWRLLP